MKDLRSRFGFHSTPFTREIAVESRLSLPLFDEPLAALLRVVDQRMSAALIAPAGTGKTALLRALRARLPEARYRVHYVKVTGLSKRDMCREIATAVGMQPAGTYPTLVRRIQEHFIGVADTDGLRPVLLVDEGHELRPDVLSMLRLITNFSMDSRLVISILLAGQFGLRALLRRDDLEDIARRLVHYAVLRPLSREEMQRYVEHRCTIAGATTVPFDDAARDAIYEIGRGNLRATDRLGLKALELANDDSCPVATANHVVEARKVLWP
jgi:type II secretory pathway predicted ATPase ExeA